MRGIRGIQHDKEQDEESNTIVVKVPTRVSTKDLIDIIKEACGANDKPEDDKIGNNTINKAVKEEFRDKEDNEAVRLIGKILSRKEGEFTGDN